MTTRMIQLRGDAGDRPTLLVGQISVDTTPTFKVWCGSSGGNVPIYPPVVSGMAAISGTPVTNQLSYWVNATDIAGLPGVEYDAANSRLQLANTYGLSWDGRTIVTSPDAGLLRITNTAGNDSDGIVFGPNTAAFPRLKRSGDGLHVRLANDSDWAPISAGVVIGEDSLQIAERGTVPGSTTGYGKIFVKTSDKRLYFLDSNGDQTELGSGQVTGSGIDGQIVFWSDTYELAGDNGLRYDSAIGVLQFGGTTAAEPALRREPAGSQLQVRDASDAGYASIRAAQFQASANVIFGPTDANLDASSYVYWSGRSELSSPADGTLLATNDAGDDFGLFVLGSVAATHPALKRVGANIEARLGNDTGSTGFICSELETSTVSTASGVLTLSPDGDAVAIVKSTACEYRAYRNNAAIDDNPLGSFAFYGLDDGAAETQYAYFKGIAQTVADGSEDGAIEVRVQSSGVDTPLMTFDGSNGAVVMNAPLQLEENEVFIFNENFQNARAYGLSDGTIIIRNSANAVALTVGSSINSLSNSFGRASFGDSSVSAALVVQTQTSLAQALLGLHSGVGRSVVFCDSTHTGVSSKNFDHPVQANPTVFINSAEDPDTDNTQWGSLAHDQINFVIGSGTDIELQPDDGVYIPTSKRLYFGDTTSYIDSYATDRLRFTTESGATVMYMDPGSLYTPTTVRIGSAARAFLHMGSGDSFNLNVNQSLKQSALIATQDYHGRQLVMCSFGNYTTDYGHDARPEFVLYGHSSEDPGTDNTEYWGLSHDGTSALLETGAGNVCLKPETDVVSIGGNTNAFPAWKRSGTALHARRADDSAFTTIQCYQILTGGDLVMGPTHLQLGASTILYWLNRSKITSDSDGEIAFLNFAETSPSTIACSRILDVELAGVGSPNALGVLESRKAFVNTGATAKVYHDLPDTTDVGIEYLFINDDTDGTRVTAPSGHTIQIAGSVSSSGGYIETTTVGDATTLIKTGATTWVASSIAGSGWAAA